MKHVCGDILSPNLNEDQPVLIFNPVSTAGVMDSWLGKQIKKELPAVHNYYEVKCMLIDAGCGSLGDTQTTCILADKGYLFVNGFVFDASNGGVMSETALHDALTDIRIFFRNYTVRIPYMWGDEATSEQEWKKAVTAIVNELVNNSITTEIWHKEE